MTDPVSVEALVKQLRGWAKSPNVNPIPLLLAAADALETAEKKRDEAWLTAQGYAEQADYEQGRAEQAEALAKRREEERDVNIAEADRQAALAARLNGENTAFRDALRRLLDHHDRYENDCLACRMGKVRPYGEYVAPAAARSLLNAEKSEAKPRFDPEVDDPCDFTNDGKPRCVMIADGYFRCTGERGHSGGHPIAIFTESVEHVTHLRPAPENAPQEERRG